MNKINLFRFVLIALLLLTYQSSTIHSSQHLLEIHEDCHLCVSDQKFDENLHKTNSPIILESYTIAAKNLEQRIVVKEPLDLLQKSLLKSTDYTGMKYFYVKQTPLGYLSTAPPYLFS